MPGFQIGEVFTESLRFLLKQLRAAFVLAAVHYGLLLVLTVCDDARETCPVYPGHAVRRHRAFRDPAAVRGSDSERPQAFRQVRDELRAYLRQLY